MEKTDPAAAPPVHATPTTDSPDLNATSHDAPASSASLSGSVNGDAEKAAPVAPAKAPRSKGKTALVMLALCLAVFLAALDVTIVATALPTISEYFGSTAGYTWIGSAFLLASAAATPIGGKISDIFGRKPIVLLANAIFFLGSVLAGAAVNIGMLIVARAIQGIGAGGLITLVNICIADLFSQKERGAYYGLIGAVWAIASSLGPIVGGAFTEKVSWRWCFYVNLPIQAVSFAITVLYLDIETPKTPIVAGLKAIDWLGSLLIVGATLMFLLGMGESHPWDSAIVLSLIIVGVFTGFLFVLWEWKFAKYPLMPLRLFAYRSNIGAYAVCACHGFAFIAGTYYMPLFFQACRNATPILSGVYILPQTMTLSVGAIFTGVFIRKTGLYLPPIYLGVTVMTLGFGLFIDFDRDSSWAKIIIYQMIAGFGVGPLFQGPLIALQTLVAPRDIATAVATFGFVRNLSTSVSIVIGQVVFQNVMSTKRGQLDAALGPQLGDQIGGGNAGANVQIIESLPEAQRVVAQDAFASSLQKMWIMYTVFAGLAIASALLITKQTLQRTHEETKTGLVEEERNRLAAKDRVDLRKQSVQNALDEAAARKDSKASASKETV